MVVVVVGGGGGIVVVLFKWLRSSVSKEMVSGAWQKAAGWAAGEVRVIGEPGKMGNMKAELSVGDDVARLPMLARITSASALSGTSFRCCCCLWWWCCGGGGKLGRRR